MELKSRSFTSKETHVAREPQVADPCSMAQSVPGAGNDMKLKSQLHTG
jgi:hypothetical protein